MCSSASCRRRLGRDGRGSWASRQLEPRAALQRVRLAPLDVRVVSDHRLRPADAMAPSMGRQRGGGATTATPKRGRRAAARRALLRRERARVGARRRGARRFRVLRRLFAARAADRFVRARGRRVDSKVGSTAARHLQTLTRLQTLLAHFLASQLLRDRRLLRANGALPRRHRHDASQVFSRDRERGGGERLSLRSRVRRAQRQSSPANLHRSRGERASANERARARAAFATSAADRRSQILRANRVQPWAAHLDTFLLPYLDAQDSKELILTPIHLIAGVFLPSALELVFGDSATAASGALAHPARYFAGVVTVGVGDAAAALVGRHFGRHRWGCAERRKTLEGSAAMFVAQLAAHALLVDGGHFAATLRSPVVLATYALTTLAEAAIQRGDNLALPAIGWTAFRMFDWLRGV